MKKITLVVPLLLISAIIFALPPEEPNSANLSDVSWHSVRLVEFENGRIDEVKQIIQKFETASASAGLPPTSVRWFESGKYDLVIIWEMDQQPTVSEWNWSPQADKWWNSFVAQEGSEEAAKKLQDQYDSMVTSTVTNIARKSK
jgi:hypothetical protein